jgi:uncharacterized membrane protein YcaP (DUF421 family)
MEHIIGVDWAKLFLPDTPLLEIFLRGTLMYLALFILLRVVLKRESGGLGITDLLVIVLIADAAQNALADDYTSLPDGLLLVITIIFWSHALNWLGHRFPRFEQFIHPRPLPLIENGRLRHDRMREELITESELASQLRLQGFEDPSQVKAAYLEGDGRISAIGHEGRSQGAPDKQL